MNAYQLHSDIQAILSRIDDGGELTDEDITTIDSLNTKVEDLVNVYWRLIRTSNACSTALRNESSYTSSKARNWEATKERCRERLKNLLVTLGEQRIRTDLCTASLCDSPPSVILDPGFDVRSLIGTDYEFLVKTDYSIIPDKLKQLAAAGGKLPEGIRIESKGKYVKV